MSCQVLQTKEIGDRQNSFEGALGFGVSCLGLGWFGKKGSWCMFQGFAAAHEGLAM